MRLIDAESFKPNPRYTDAMNAAILAQVLRQPTIEAEPVKHGRWITVTKNIAWKCSDCGELSCCEPNYCPNCGAKMDGGAENE